MTIPSDSNLPSQPPAFTAAGVVPGTGDTVVPPRQVVIGFWLYIAAAVLSVISLIIALAGSGGARDAVAAQLTEQGVEVSDSAINALIGASIGVSIFFAVVWTAAFVLFAFFMKRGANWARIVLTVITVLSLINLFSGFGLGAVQVVASVIATVLIWLRPASEYFAAVKARKSGAPAQ
jgi:hypothetical protein